MPQQRKKTKASPRAKLARGERHPRAYATRDRKEMEKPAKEKADRSWVPGDKGQGREGLSKGYGGSAGKGTGASGPEKK